MRRFASRVAEESASAWLHDARDVEPAERSDADEFAASLGDAPKKRARSSKRRLSDAIAELDRVFPKGELGAKFEEKHLVALYAKLHEQVYGAGPGELEEGKNFLAACSAASRLVRVDFKGELRGAIEFLRWTWRRERFVVQKRRQSGAAGRRIGWRLQFASRDLVTDYRVDLAGQSERAPRSKERA